VLAWGVWAGTPPWPAKLEGHDTWALRRARRWPRPQPLALRRPQSGIPAPPPPIASRPSRFYFYYASRARRASDPVVLWMTGASRAGTGAGRSGRGEPSLVLSSRSQLSASASPGRCRNAAAANAVGLVTASPLMPALLLVSARPNCMRARLASRPSPSPVDPTLHPLQAAPGALQRSRSFTVGAMGQERRLEWRACWGSTFPPAAAAATAARALRLLQPSGVPTRRPRTLMPP
jgi:hypothetical protein